MQATPLQTAEASGATAAGTDVATAAPVAPAANAPASDGLVHISDATGRDIGISTELDVLTEMRLIKMLGSNNSNYLYLCSQLARVKTFGGEKIAQPNSEREFEALAVRLGRPGMNAISRYFTEVEISAVGTGENAERDAVKK